MTIKVRMVPVQPHCFLYGGFDMQMVRTMESLSSIGIDAMALDYWSKDINFDVLHVWGFELQHESLLRIAKSYGKKIVLSPLLPYPTPLRRLQEMLGFNRRTKKMVKYIDKLLVVNELQAAAAVKLYGFNPDAVEIVPTMIDPIFFKHKAHNENNDIDEKYIICVGNILPRKNQVNLARAAVRANCSIKFVGAEMGGEEEYARKLQNEINGSGKLAWYRDLSWTELFELISKSSGVAIPSFTECQPASALEGIALNKPILIANRPYAYQKIFEGALCVDPSSINEMATGLVKILAEGSKYVPKNKMIQECRVEEIGKKLINIYAKVLKSR